MKTSSSNSAILTFLAQEARGLGGAFWRLFWKVTVALALLVVIVGLAGSRSASATSAQDSSLLITTVAYVAVGLYFGIVVGAVVGLVAVLWRLFGPSFLVVLVVAPALVLLVVWLFHSPISSAAIHFLDSVIAAARHEGLQHTVQATEGMRLSCGGGAFAVLFLVLLSPFLLADIGLILADPAVLWAFLKFAGAMALTLAAATSAAFFFAFPVLVAALVRRGRKRFAQLPLQPPCQNA
jgi:hypothetical protein